MTIYLFMEIFFFSEEYVYALQREMCTFGILKK